MRRAIHSEMVLQASAPSASAYVADKDMNSLADLSNLQGLPSPPALEEVYRIIDIDTPIRIRM